MDELERLILPSQLEIFLGDYTKERKEWLGNRNRQQLP